MKTISPGVGEDELLEVVVRVGDVGGLDLHAHVQQPVDQVTAGLGGGQSPGRGVVLGRETRAQHRLSAQQVQHLTELQVHLASVLGLLRPLLGLLLASWSLHWRWIHVKICYDLNH